MTAGGIPDGAQGGAYAGAPAWSGPPEIPTGGIEPVKPPPDRGRPIAMAIAVLLLVAAAVGTGMVVLGEHKPTKVLDLSTPLAPQDTTTVPPPVVVAGVAPIGPVRPVKIGAFSLSVPAGCLTGTGLTAQSPRVTVASRTQFACQEGTRGVVMVLTIDERMPSPDWYAAQDFANGLAGANAGVHDLAPRVTTISGRPAILAHGTETTANGTSLALTVGAVTVGKNTYLVIALDNGGTWVSGDSVLGSFTARA